MATVEALGGEHFLKPLFEELRPDPNQPPNPSVTLRRLDHTNLIKHTGGGGRLTSVFTRLIRTMLPAS